MCRHSLEISFSAWVAVVRYVFSFIHLWVGFLKLAVTIIDFSFSNEIAYQVRDFELVTASFRDYLGCSRLNSEQLAFRRPFQLF